MNEIVDLSRLQFAITAMYHFLFVPLTLGMTWLLVIMESLYVITDNPLYRDMTKFWGKLFGINFALGVTTGITLEFQFGTNWAYYSHYVGDIFGAPLAIEGMMAFFLESTFIGLFFFGWDRLTKSKHLLATVLMAIGTNLSALWILIANGWMQNPVGSKFNYLTMRMELVDFWAVLFNPVAQIKFAHTVSAGYVTGSMFVLSISAWYLLKKRHIEFAKKSFRIAAIFGFISICSVTVFGDESGVHVSQAQPSKMAAMESMWETDKAPAPFNVVVLANEDKQKNDFALQIPWAMGLLATHSMTEKIPGILEIRAKNRQRVESGIKAIIALEALRKDPKNSLLKQQFERYQKDLGFGLLLKKYTKDIRLATPKMIDQAAHDTVPLVTPLFWSFRLMVGFGFAMLALFGLATWYAIKDQLVNKRWLLRWSLWFLLVPWVCCELGWFVAEYGRQPWTIYGILPTHLSVSTISIESLYGSLGGFITFYSLLFIVEIYLMIKFVRQGPLLAGSH